MSIEINVINAAVIIFVFILTYIGIIHTNIDKTTAAVFGGIVTMIFVLILELENPHHPGIPIEQNDLIHLRDLEVIGLIVGFLMLVDGSAEVRRFHYVSIRILLH